MIEKLASEIAAEIKNNHELNYEGKTTEYEIEIVVDGHLFFVDVLIWAKDYGTGKLNESDGLCDSDVKIIDAIVSRLLNEDGPVAPYSLTKLSELVLNQLKNYYE